jgi:hypothetical protein
MCWFLIVGYFSEKCVLITILNISGILDGNFFSIIKIAYKEARNLKLLPRKIFV